MKSTIRKIGNSRGVLIPASLLASCGINDEIELKLDGNRIVIEPVNRLREGWFDNYSGEEDKSVWPEVLDLESELEDWEW